MVVPPSKSATDPNIESDSVADLKTDTVSDYDSPWKEALEQYFPAFIELLVPQLYPHINWSVTPVFLDKELQAIARKAATGKRYVDKLVRVLSTDDEPLWLLIHIEVQSKHISIKGLSLFSERMFNYYCGIRLHHAKVFQGHPVNILSLGVLTASGSQRNGIELESTLSYTEGAPGQNHVQFTFPVIHLEDWLGRWDELERLAAANPFAVIVMAQLRAQQTHPGDPQRLVSKTTIMKLLYKYSYSKADIQQLFRLTDWMLDLSDELYPAFEQAITELEQEHKVSYVTSIERMGEKRGMEKGLLQGLRKGKNEGLRDGEAALLLRLLTHKFGTLPVEVQQRLQDATPAQLETWSLNILDATNLDDVFTNE